MKIFKIIVAFLVVVFVALALLAPRDFRIERSIIIEQPRTIVFDEIKHLSRHHKWNAWALKDPDTPKNFQGEDATVGFIASWDSENPELGTAEQEIQSIVDGERFDTEIRFKKPFEGDFHSYIITRDADNGQTEVIVGMHDEMPFPIYIISFILNVCADQQQKMQEAMDESLNNLKRILEHS